MPLVNARVYNDTDIEVVIKIVGIAPNHQVRFALDDGTRSNIFPLATGKRVFAAWDALSNQIVGPVRIEDVSQPARIRLIGTNGGYDWSYAAVPTGDKP